MLHERSLNAEYLVERQALIPRRVGSDLDENHALGSERRSRDPERLRGRLGEREKGRIELEVGAVELDREFRIRLGDGDGDGLRLGAIGET